MANDHPVIVAALRGIDQEQKSVIRARVKGDRNFIYYEIYSHSPGYPIWRNEIARQRFQMEDGSLLTAGPEVRFQLIGQNTVQLDEVPE